MIEPTEEYEDVYPLLGAIGPYLNFTTGHMNPVDEPEEVVYPEETESNHWSDEDKDYWEADEK